MFYIYSYVVMLYAQLERLIVDAQQSRTAAPYITYNKHTQNAFPDSSGSTNQGKCFRRIRQSPRCGWVVVWRWCSRRPSGYCIYASLSAEGALSQPKIPIFPLFTQVSRARSRSSALFGRVHGNSRWKGRHRRRQGERFQMDY